MGFANYSIIVTDVREMAGGWYNKHLSPLCENKTLGRLQLYCSRLQLNKKAVLPRTVKVLPVQALNHNCKAAPLAT